jgi:hypothetical protein
MMPNDEEAAVCNPSPIYLPFGWAAASLAESAKAAARATHAAQSMAQLSLALFFMALETH